MKTDIKIVKTKKDLKQFIRVPYTIFNNSPYWVPPLIRDELEMFDRKKNPSYETADSRLFIAYHNGTPVGRIAAILSYAGNEKNNARNLRFGWFDTIDDYEVARILFEAVEKKKRYCAMGMLFFA